MKFIKLTGADGQGPVHINASHIVSLWRDERCTLVNTINQTSQEWVGVAETPEQILALIGDDLTQRKARAFEAMSRFGWMLLLDAKGGWDVIDEDGDTVCNSSKSDLEAIEAALAKVGAR